MYRYRFNLVKVIDGDTVDVDIDLGFGVWLKKERIRLAGIDTPESRTRELEEKKFGLIAKAKVKELLNYDSCILVTFKDEKGKFGRILGDFEMIYKGTKAPFSLVEYLITEHYGVRYFGQNKDLIRTEHLANREWLLKRGKVK